MILNNYWAWREANSHADDTQDYVSSMKDMNGTAVSMCGYNSTSASTDYIHNSLKSRSFTKDMIHYVTSDQSETKETDWELPTAIGVSDKTTSVISSLINGKLKYTFTCGGSNKTSEEIVIRKVCITKRIFVPNLWKEVLMAVVELSEPITVPAGSGYSIVIEMIEE